MLINLPIKSFSFFKVIVGTLFLLITSLFPYFGYITLIMLIFGRAHSIGAWLSMWRAGKFNIKYFFWVSFLIVGVSFWGIKIASPLLLSSVSYLLFSFHFIYDEFDLQEEGRTWNNLISSLSPALILFLFLIKDFYHVDIGFNLILSILLFLISIELFFLKEVNWFFVQTKILIIFIIYMTVSGYTSISILNIFLMFHYFFWFIYPVYKLHKYKREERDGFIMMLGIIVLLSTFVYSSKIWGGVDMADATRLFLIATTVHILATAPFGYFFGLPKPKKYLS